MDINFLMLQPGWNPTTDAEVNEIIKELSLRCKERDRIVSTADTEIKILTEAKQEAVSNYEKFESLAKAKLEHYVLNEVSADDRRETKTLAKYKVARGEIIVTKPSIQMVKPDDDILKNLYPAFVEAVPASTKFKWGDLKKNLSIDDTGKVVDNEGKVVDCVTVAAVPAEVKVSFTL
jgi:hypothetical protein